MSVSGEATDTTTESGERRETTIGEAGSAEELLRSLGIDLAQLQFGNIEQQTALQSLLGGQVRDIFSPEAIAESERLASEAGRIRPEEEARISQIEQESLAAAESDINRQLETGLGLLKQEAAPSRGLRFRDTPILDRGGELVGESLRLQSQAGRDIRARGAEQRLQYPLERQRFQELLRENARRFRLGLTGTTGHLGLGLAGLGDPYKQQQLFLAERLAQPTTSGTSEETSRSYRLGGGGSVTPSPTPG